MLIGMEIVPAHGVTSRSGGGTSHTLSNMCSLVKPFRPRFRLSTPFDGAVSEPSDRGGFPSQTRMSTFPPAGPAERGGKVRDRRALAGLDELLERHQLLAVRLRDERAQLLAHERRQHLRPELAVDASDPPPAPLDSHEDESSAGGEGPAEV